MQIINYLSNMIIPVIITIIVIQGIREGVKVFDVFLDGAKEGVEIVIGLFPTLLGLFVAVGVLRGSGLIDFIINLMQPIIKCIGVPQEIMPLAILRPISRECIYCYWNRYNEAVWSR